jgi:serine/threonine protein kinase/Tol biopolymer transport system component
MIGSTLSHFKITDKLGEGGMGEVYRAEDTKLGREVAIKVLPEAVAADAERLARFEREAKVLASLNHPHIAAIYSFEHTEWEGASPSPTSGDLNEPSGPQDPRTPRPSVHFLVMELASGEDLSQRLARGAMSVDEAVPIARQIAEALEAAHEQGIIHRDLKPGNIKVTPDGQVKVLDFGLAKALESQAAGSESQGLSMSPTLTAQMTTAGVLLGTAAYMSPEQAKGIEADRRADVWAFGVVLWEMLTGQRLFRGDSVSDTLAAVLRDEIDGEALPNTVPQTTRALLARCLDRDPKSRLRDIGEARVALATLESGGVASTLLSSFGAAAPAEVEPTQSSKLPWVIAASAMVLALLLGALWLLGEEEASSPPLVESAILAPSGTTLDVTSGLAFSPDGAEVALVALGEDGIRRLWVRSLASSTPRLLEGTEGAIYPFWSPDSRNLGFMGGGDLKRVAATGGPIQTLASVKEGRGGTWGPDGRIVYSPDFRGGLSVVPAAGGESVELTQADMERGETAHRFPFILPDGEHVLFLSQTAEGGSRYDESRIEVVSLETGERTPIMDANSSVVYSPSGHLLFWRDGSLMVIGFDADSLNVEGDPVPIAEDVAYTGNEYSVFSLSQTGSLAYQSGASTGAMTRLYHMDMKGTVLGEPSPAALHSQVALSHDGRRAAFRGADNTTIWVRDLARGTATRFTFEDGDHFSPLWSPDDKWILYTTNRTGIHQVFRKLSSGLGQEELVLELEEKPDLADLMAWDWSADGRYISMDMQNRETDLDIVVYDLQEQKLTTLIQSPFYEGDGHFSPDGRWLAYSSGESGNFQIFIVSLSGEGGKFQVSTDGGLHPMWHPSGEKLFYVSSRSELMAVDLSLDEDVVIGDPQPLFRVRYPINNDYPFQVMPDGESFLINQFDDLGEAAPMTLVQNWTRLLQEE